MADFGKFCSNMYYCTVLLETNSSSVGTQNVLYHISFFFVSWDYCQTVTTPGPGVGAAMVDLCGRKGNWVDCDFSLPCKWVGKLFLYF